MIGKWQTPYLVSIGWLEAEASRSARSASSLRSARFSARPSWTSRLILIQAARRFRQQSAAAGQAAEDWKRVNMLRLVLWVVFWGAATVVLGSQVLHQPVFFLVVAVGLCFLFVLVNGISLGISDWNPISSAFVMTVFILAALGLRDPGVGLLCASILLIACSEGGDMQQDRSTGWRLGTNRIVQFRYQVIGIAMGAVLAVVLAKTFMNSYPVLRVDQFSHPHIEGAEQWQSAMTYKIRRRAQRHHQSPAARDESAAARHRARPADRNRAQADQAQPALPASRRRPPARRARADFVLDAVRAPQPLRLVLRRVCGVADGALVDGGRRGGVGVRPGAGQARRARTQPAKGELPADMSTMSLVGGGLIAGDSLAALSVGMAKLLKTVFHP